ncbi:G-type lectin S-receptor-like serine/threonine-protein kinase LECRK3 [Aristolochia californica]|uniref:G-type lectin S-receptor-like serine/threonine-protein kinase LECRK3 n=1 Tax=Aristolochia californica TaxID=171875 RepID=UPI0035D9D8E9
MTSSVFVLILLGFVSLLPSVNGQTYRNVSLGSSLSAGDKNSSSSWVSPSGEFAFGFHPLPLVNIFLLAIWYDKLPEKTVVWYANGDNPVQSGSKVELTTRGQLVLRDHQGRDVWKQDPLSGNISYAAMLDTGNFVMVSTSFDQVWQSFDLPTDTILPTQILGSPSVLSSRLSDTNFSKGRFELRLQTDNNLVLYRVSSRKKSYPAYWASNTLTTGDLLIFNESGAVYLQLKNSTRFNLGPTSYTLSTRDFYQRMTLEFNGVFSLFVYPKTSKSGSRPQSWSVRSSIPQNMCMIGGQELGPGACGFNSYCELDQDGKPTCLCPNGYTYSDPNDLLKGCKQRFRSQKCESDGSNKGPQPYFDMMAMVNTDWPLADFDLYESISEDDCREACLVDCLCDVAIFRTGNCWKKRLPLSNGRKDPRIGGKAFIKVPAANSTTTPSPSHLGGKKSDRGTLLVILWSFLGSSAFLNLLLLSLVLLGLYLSRYKKKKVRSDSEVYGAILSNFSYKDLEKATDGFKEVLGRGASGTVYKGLLPLQNSSRFVAVKRLDKLPKDKDQEFKNEMQVISRVHHKNLVPLLGFCDEEHHRLLVYEFMNHGSLSRFLLGGSKPTWNQRVQIAFGIARGLIYLHEECQTQIIHCDIKPENVLLDESLTPRIADFGLAKLLRAEQTRTTTGIRGTKGYVAPEWFKSLPITNKVDVYSFGILLLEIIFCRKNVELNSDKEVQAILSDWVCDCYEEGKLGVLVEDDEEALGDFKKVERLVKVAIWCIQEEPSLRPSMKKVSQMLEGTVEVPRPPHPSSYISTIE